MKKLRTVVSRAEEVLIEVLLVMMCMAMVAQVVCRYVFNNPLTWSEEAARLLFIWITFVGAGWAAHNHLHIRMDVILTRLPAKIRKAVEILINVISFCIYVSVIPSGMKYVRAMSNKSASTLPIPMSLVCFAIPLGCALVAFALFVETWIMIREDPESTGAAEEEAKDAAGAPAGAAGTPARK